MIVPSFSMLILSGYLSIVISISLCVDSTIVASANCTDSVASVSVTFWYDCCRIGGGKSITEQNFASPSRPKVNEAYVDRILTANALIPPLTFLLECNTVSLLQYLHVNIITSANPFLAPKSSSIFIFPLTFFTILAYATLFKHFLQQTYIYKFISNCWNPIFILQ